MQNLLINSEMNDFAWITTDVCCSSSIWIAIGGICIVTNAPYFTADPLNVFPNLEEKFQNDWIRFVARIFRKWRGGVDSKGDQKFRHNTFRILLKLNVKTQQKIIKPKAQPADNPEEADGAEGEEAPVEKPKKEKKKKVFDVFFI